MASASHINLYTPFSGGRISKCSCLKFPSSLTIGTAFSNSVKAFAEKRDNLDHLQRITPQQLEVKKETQVAPGFWDRFPTARTMQQMMDAMERTMEDPYAYSSWLPVSLNRRDAYIRGRTPWAIKERKKDYKVRFDMHGMTKKAVKLWIEENILVLKPEKGPETTQECNKNNNEDIEDEGWPTKNYGSYGCRIALP